MLESVISKFEKESGQSADYLRDVAAGSKAAFAKFMLMMPMANHRRSAPKAAWHAARLVATRYEDCGPCVQIVIDMAIADGVSPKLIQDVWHGRHEALPREVVLAMQLASAVVDSEESEDAAARSAEAASLLGQSALVDLAFAISTARVFPTLKRSLGHARSCSLVDLHVGDSRVGDQATVEGPIAQGS